MIRSGIRDLRNNKNVAKTAMVPISILENLALLRELGQDALRALVQDASYQDIPARSVIYRKGSQDEWTQFLVSGTILLTENDSSANRTLIGLGNAAVADHPLGFQPPHADPAIASTECRQLRFPRARLQQLLEQARLPEIEVTELAAEEGAASDRLFVRLVQDLMEERLDLPSMPDIAVRVREAIANPESDTADVARIIQADPVVATQLTKVANSTL